MYLNNSRNRNNCINQRQLQLSNTLRRLWTEHVMWTRSFIISTAFDLDDLDYVTRRLLRNPADFSKLLRTYYGNNAAKKFEELFRAHLEIAGKLVNAAKAGNESEAEELRGLWYENADELATFLSDINPYWNKSDWKTLLFDHLKMTENEAGLILNRHYAESIDEYDNIQSEALKMADLMSYGIINQFKL